MLKKVLPASLFITSLFWGCGKGINRAKSFPYGKGYVLVDQYGNKVSLDDLKGKALVVGYIYTHCPDICPFITLNMKKAQKLINSDPKLKYRVTFVSITFDPRRDKPEVLKNYSELYGIDTSNWLFLTADQKTIDSLMKDLDIVIDVGPIDIQVRNDTDTIYNYEIVHTDRIHVVDPKGRIIGYFKGSSAKAEDILKAVKKSL